jgi:hypothetical protein
MLITIKLGTYTRQEILKFTDLVPTLNDSVVICNPLPLPSYRITKVRLPVSQRLKDHNVYAYKVEEL